MIIGVRSTNDAKFDLCLVLTKRTVVSLADSILRVPCGDSLALNCSPDAHKAYQTGLVALESMTLVLHDGPAVCIGDTHMPALLCDSCEGKFLSVSVPRDVLQTCHVAPSEAQALVVSAPTDPVASGGFHSLTIAVVPDDESVAQVFASLMQAKMSQMRRSPFAGEN